MDKNKLKQDAIKFARMGNPKSYLHETGLIDGYMAGYNRALAEISNENSALPIPDVSGSLPISDVEYSNVIKAIYPKDNSRKFSRQ
jgi:hypothetical protein